MIYFTSDTHFGHSNIISYTKRPFKTVKEMNSAILGGILLSENDILIHLGDVFYKNEGELNFLYLLKKHKKNILILGNHDTKSSLNPYFDEIYQNYIFEYNGVKIECVHHPDKQSGKADLTLCGHIHQKWKIKYPGEYYDFHPTTEKNERYVFSVPTINVSVENWDYKAVSIDEILSIYKSIQV
ncbi:metallophosphoesterase [bacterium]|nr:metallophosphoesterase [bacterium]